MMETKEGEDVPVERIPHHSFGEISIANELHEAFPSLCKQVVHGISL